DRAQTVTNLGEIRTWSDFLLAMQKPVLDAKAQGGTPFRILTGTVTSPTLAAQIQNVLKQIPGAKWHNGNLRDAMERVKAQNSRSDATSTPCIGPKKPTSFFLWMRISWQAGRGTLAI
ncbi:MAG TPA: hypothetical protein VFF95_06990, partial [Candidatus Binatus sp.]|nr:hypothetical protein [Candidatus Binatus sp.]